MDERVFAALREDDGEEGPRAYDIASRLLAHSLVVEQSLDRLHKAGLATWRDGWWATQPPREGKPIVARSTDERSSGILANAPTWNEPFKPGDVIITADRRMVRVVLTSDTGALCVSPTGDESWLGVDWLRRAWHATSEERDSVKWVDQKSPPVMHERMPCANVAVRFALLCDHTNETARSMCRCSGDCTCKSGTCAAHSSGVDAMPEWKKGDVKAHDVEATERYARIDAAIVGALKKSGRALSDREIWDCIDAQPKSDGWPPSRAEVESRTGALLKSRVLRYCGDGYPDDFYALAERGAESIISGLRAENERLDAECERLTEANVDLGSRLAQSDKMADQAVDECDSAEEVLEETAQFLGCTREWSSAHDHRTCVPELAAGLRKALDGMTMERDAALKREAALRDAMKLLREERDGNTATVTELDRESRALEDALLQERARAATLETMAQEFIAASKLESSIRGASDEFLWARGRMLATIEALMPNARTAVEQERDAARVERDEQARTAREYLDDIATVRAENERLVRTSENLGGHLVQVEMDRDDMSRRLDRAEEQRKSVERERAIVVDEVRDVTADLEAARAALIAEKEAHGDTKSLLAASRRSLRIADKRLSEEREMRNDAVRRMDPDAPERGPRIEPTPTRIDPEIVGRLVRATWAEESGMLVPGWDALPEPNRRAYRRIGVVLAEYGAQVRAAEIGLVAECARDVAERMTGLAGAK